MIPTAGQVAAALTVVPARPLVVGDFPVVATPRVAGRSAETDWVKSVSANSTKLVNGEYRLTRVAVKVTFDGNNSWALSGMTPLLLLHEQGHFTNTVLIMRDLCRKLMSLSIDAEVLKSLQDVKKKDPAHLLHEADKRLLADGKAAIDAAMAFLDRTQADAPAPRSYDTFTGRGLLNGTAGTANMQKTWSDMLSFATTGDCELSLAMTMSGIPVP